MIKPHKCRVEFSNGIIIEDAYYDGMQIVYYSNNVCYQIPFLQIPKDTKIMIK